MNRKKTAKSSKSDFENAVIAKLNEIMVRLAAAEKVRTSHSTKLDEISTRLIAMEQQLGNSDSTKLDEILAQLTALKQNKSILHPALNARKKVSRSKLKRKLVNPDQEELLKLGLPINSVKSLDEFDEKLEATEFFAKVVGPILS